MEHIKLYLTLLALITVVSILFRKSNVPTTLILVIVGMVLSYISLFEVIPDIPRIEIDPNIILDGFLPLLLYTATHTASWHAIKADARTITLMSIGHVLFITILVAGVIHYLVPQFSWPLAFILGAVISPPDDVAILAIGEKVRMPNRILTILRGEALLNDATALTIFKFALAALLTHEFHPFQSLLVFAGIVVGETLYGILVGYVIGEVRLRINEPIIQVLISILTPFIAYIPANYVCGSGVISTVVTGIFIAQVYWGRFPPDVRLNTRAVWSTLEFSLQCTLFLLVGLNMNYAMESIASVSTQNLILYSAAIVTTIIGGRFVWVYAIVYIPRLVSAKMRKHDPAPPWQFPFLISWAGMRGGISLAAALAVPSLGEVGGIHPRQLLLFLVFVSIIATLLIQGLSLPWIIKRLGLQSHNLHEKDEEHQSEIAIKIEMTNAALNWLTDYATKIKDNTELAEEIRLQIKVHESVKHHYERQLDTHIVEIEPEHPVLRDDTNILLSQIIAIERTQLEKSWHENKIPYAIKIKLEKQLDLRAKHIDELV